MITVREIGKNEFRKFINLPYRLYKGDKNWVPPLFSEMKSILGDNDLFRRAPHAVLLAEEGKRVVARVVCGINPMSKAVPGVLSGYFSLFEAESEEAGKAVLDHAEAWCREHGAGLIIGPVSPDDGEGWRGFLVEGRNGPPLLMNAYTQEWYPAFVEKLGYAKYEDNFALKLDALQFQEDKLRVLVEEMSKRHGFRVDSVDLNNIDKEAEDFFQVLVRAYPPEWDTETPTYEFVKSFIKSVRSLMDPDIICIARKIDTNEPIAFVVALPDYNEVIKKMNGKLFPFGFLIFLWGKRRIRHVRVLQQFCVPEYRSKGAILAVYYQIFQNAVRKGYVGGEASTIAEENFKSWQPVRGVGGEIYRVYRYYKKDL